MKMTMSTFLILLPLIISAKEITTLTEITLLRDFRRTNQSKSVTLPQGSKVELLEMYNNHCYDDPVLYFSIDDTIFYSPYRKHHHFLSTDDFPTIDTHLTTKVKEGLRTLHSVKPTLDKIDEELFDDYMGFWNYTNHHWQDSVTGRKQMQDDLTGEMHVKLFINSEGSVIHDRIVLMSRSHIKLEGHLLALLCSAQFPALAEGTGITELHVRLVLNGNNSTLITYE